MRVGIFGHYGNGNLGDEAITEAAIGSSRELLGATEVRLYSVVPEDSAARHGLDAYPIRRGAQPHKATTLDHLPTPRHVYRPLEAEVLVTDEAPVQDVGLRAFLKKSTLIRRMVNLLRGLAALPGRICGETRFLFSAAKSLDSLDLLVIAGSNQYLDNFGGVMGFPYTLMKWTALCRIKGIKVVLLSIGAGPIDHALSRMMVRWTIRRSLFHSYRDEASLALIEGTPARLGGAVYPDLAANLQFKETPLDLESTPPTAAINPMPVYGDYWFVQDREKYRAYLTKLATLALHLDDVGFHVRLFPTQTRDMDAIKDTVAIAKQMNAAAAERLEICQARETHEVMAIICDAHVIVPTRFHGAVLGILAKRLVLAVCYQAKAAAVLAAAGQAAFAKMLDDVSADELVATFDELWANRNAAANAVRQRSADVRSQIDNQYKIVRDLMNGKPM